MLVVESLITTVLIRSLEKMAFHMPLVVLSGTSLEKL
jgi:hypothetical protein